MRKQFDSPDFPVLDGDYHEHQKNLFEHIFGTSLDDLGKFDATTRERCLMLSIFLEDDRIPLAILERLWNVDNAEAVATVDTLCEYSMVIEGGPDEGYVKLHDLQRD